MEEGDAHAKKAGKVYGVYWSVRVNTLGELKE
jgi:hypothetical protein